MEINDVINEARGFLNAIKQLCRDGTIMWINCFPIQDNLDSTVKAYIEGTSDIFSYSGNRSVGYEELQPIIEKYIFEKIENLSCDSSKKLLEWQFIEYYGLASTVDNENNPFNPLVSEKSILLDLTSDEYVIEASFVTPIGNNIVVTTLGKVT